MPRTNKTQVLLDDRDLERVASGKDNNINVGRGFGGFFGGGFGRFFGGGFGRGFGSGFGSFG